MIRRIFRPLNRTARDIDAELREEIESHVEIAAESLMRQGLSREDAMRAARTRFGDFDASMKTLRRSARQRQTMRSRRELVRGVAQDLRFAWRQAVRAPGFSLAVVLTLGLGMGANVAMFGIVDRLLFRPPAGIADADGLRRVYFTQTFSWAGLTTQEQSNFPDYLVVKGGGSFSGAAAHFSDAATLGRGEAARRVIRTLATASYWSILGARPQLGRLFTESDDRRGATPVAVLNARLWRTVFGGDTAIVGRSIVLGGISYIVAGVADERFDGVNLERTDVWVPLGASADHVISDAWDTRGVTWLKIIVRLKRGVSSELADAELTTLFRRTLQERQQVDGNPARPATDIVDPTARAQSGSIIEARAPTGWLLLTARISTWLAAMGVLVLLIATANVANLLLARASTRQREIAVRTALGGARARLAGLLLSESALFAGAGLCVAVVLAIWGSALMERLLLPEGARGGARVDFRMLGVAFVVMTVVALLTSLSPIAHALRKDVLNALKAGARGATLRRSRARAWLIAFQGALSVVLLVGAGLFVRSLHRVTSADIGFDASKVSVAWLELAGSSIDRSRLQPIYTAVAERLRADVRVENAALATSVPFWSSMSSGRVRVDGRDSIPIPKDGGPYVVNVTPEYFETLGTSIVHGRGFTNADMTARVTIVSRTMAELLWPDGRAVGRCMYLNRSPDCIEVVGVAEDARRQRIEATPVMQYYAPLRATGASPVLFVRSDDPHALTSEIRRAFTALGADIPNVRIQVLEDLIAPHRRPWRLGAAVFSAFGALALVIAVIGLYSVLAYEVARRRQEFGIRVALGARSGDILRLVLSQATALVGVGMFIGLAVSFAGARFIAPLLYETSPRDSGVFVGVVVVLIVAALAASMIPAVRARRVEPNLVLREE